MLPYPNGADAVPFTRDIYVASAQFLPFASLTDGYAAFRRSSVVDGQIGVFSSGTLLRTQPSDCMSWWNCNVWAKEVVSSLDEPPPEQESVQGNGIQVSALKVRVKWAEYPSRERDILMDIGSGFTIAVGPTPVVEVDLMVPDPTKFVGVVPTGLDNLRTSTYVVASAWPVAAPIGRPSGRVSQAVFLTADQQSQLVQIGDGARFVQIFSDVVGGGLGFTSPAFRVRDNILDRPLGRISFPVTEFNSPKTEVAQNAKFISLEGTPAAGALFNVVQELEL